MGVLLVTMDKTCVDPEKSSAEQRELPPFQAGPSNTIFLLQGQNAVDCHLKSPSHYMKTKLQCKR